MPNKPVNVDQYLAQGCGRCELGNTPECKVHPWQTVLQRLRSILSNTKLREEIKWSAPCYTYQGHNVLMLSALKDSVVLGFFRGAEMQDLPGLLEKPGANTNHARNLHFTSEQAITDKTETIYAYIEEAIRVALLPKPATNSELPELPEALIQAFERDSEFQQAFAALTLGRQRSHLLHYTAAKQAQTVINRIEKSKTKVLAGKGWNEY